MLGKLLKILRPAEVTEPVAIRLVGDPITEQEFNAVKHSLKLVGKARGYEDVKAVALMHGIGRSTAYRIKAAHSFADYKGLVKKLHVKQTGSRAHKVVVAVR